MVNFTRRELTKTEALVSQYEGLVSDLCEGAGYGMCIYEYVNDMGCRQSLEDARAQPEVAKLWVRVAAADARLRAVLLPTKRCIHGDAAPAAFWFWGYPPNSPELEQDLLSLGIL